MGAVSTGTPQRAAAPPTERRSGRIARRVAYAAVALVTVALLVTGGLLVNHYVITTWRDVPAATAPADTALKGFVPFAPEPGDAPALPPDALPYSLEWFYLPVNAIVTAEDTYDWATLDRWLNSIAARGHQSVFRLYLDYPGRQTGVPRYLIDAGIDTSRRYTDYGNNNTSFSPDYDDPRIITMLQNLVDALGQRYDADPRIGYITQGLTGFWGENHTYPYDGTASSQNWTPSSQTQNTLYAAWDDAFDTTPTLARYPRPANEPHDIGYHDDSFAYSTLPTADWHFLAQLDAAGATDTWQTAPIGGEIYPQLQPCLYNTHCSPDPLTDTIDQAHPTWLLNQQAFKPGYPGDQRTQALTTQTQLGYTFRIERVGFNRTLGGARTISIVVKNLGVAPLYYAWPAEIALLDPDGMPVVSAQAQTTLSGLLPGDELTVSATLPTEGLEEQEDQDARLDVAVRVRNPVDGGTPVRFANAGQSDGADGWVGLGEMSW